MKKSIVLIILIGSFISSNCHKEDIEVKYLEGYIVGFTPCTVRHQYRMGYIIISEDKRDSFQTYNISDEIYKMPASIIVDQTDTLYTIPESYFDDYNAIYFPVEVRYNYGIKIFYKYADKDELFSYGCSGDVIFTNFTQIIVLNAAKN